MQPEDRLIRAIDNLIQESYAPTKPGAAVIVVREGEVIYRKGQGMANLEFGIPIEPDMVFRIGSMTKQFTAVAILMLVDQGKLALDDSITKFLPDYPTHDYLITVEHLLTHTSGIKGYTDMPEPSFWKKDFTVQELIDFFKYQPMQFAPGKCWAYNNSGYVLLGAVIEKVSGQTYEQFIQQSIFDPLGMKQSLYDNPLRIVPRRVAGYAKSPAGYTNSAYLSLTTPYAGGALASTVDDLALWDSALYTEQLLTQETLQRAFTPYRLIDGSSTAYGYGWEIGEYAGHPLIEHNGGINGFNAHAIRMSADRVYVAVLSNLRGPEPESLAFKIAALVIGQPYQDPAPVELSLGILAQYEGVYQINALGERRIMREGNRLFSQRGQGPRFELVPFSPNQFFLKGMSHFHLTFVSDANDVVTAVEMRGRTGMPEIAKRIDESASRTT